MEDSQKSLSTLEDDIFKENIANIYEYLYLNYLDNRMIKSLNLFMDAYNQTLSDYLNSSKPSTEITKKLQILSGPINFVYSHFPDNNLEPHPAADIIKKRINDYSSSLEKGFARTRKNPNASYVPLEEEYMQTNGYTTSVIIVSLTVFFGMILAAILFLIK